jgi:hypothetical protein
VTFGDWLLADIRQTDIHQTERIENKPEAQHSWWRVM